MNLFLKAKHWQLFLIIFALPFFVYIIMAGVFIANINRFENIESSDQFFRMFMPVIIIGVITSVVFYCWKWSVAMGLQKYIPDEFKMNTWKFVVTFIFPIIYSILAFVLVFTYVIPVLNETPNINPWVFILLIPVHLFMVFCTFYVMYFIAKAILLAENPSFPHSGNTGLYFVLVWFYFVGFWILQPKINKIVSGNPGGNTYKSDE